MLYKSIIRVAGIAAMFAVMFVGGAFAQRVGDVVQVEGQSYRVEESRNGRLVLQEVRGHDRGNRRDRGSRYEVVNQSLSWTEAKREAERRGGYLAVITSEAEQRTIESLIRDGTRDRYWIGGYCESNRVWKWVTGERMSYTNWGPDDPNNYGGNENVMSFTRQPFGSQGNRTLLGQWIDEVNGRNNGYIIEFD